MKMNIDSVQEPVLEVLKKNLIEDGAVSPEVILITERGALTKKLFDFSNIKAARRDIRSKMKKYNAHVVVIIYQSLGSYDLSAHPGIVKERQQAIAIYFETVDDRILMLQDYEIDKSGDVIFGTLFRLKNPPQNELTGLFKP
jgi:hypothetical protein